MKIVIVFDSVFGNTEKIAQAMGEALRSQGDVKTLRVGDVTPADLTDLKCLIVGSPTRGFRPTPAMKKFLADIPARGLQSVKVAAFDTRASMDNVPGILRLLVNIFGYAAKPIADRLVKKGGKLVRPPEGFFVKDSEGPLQDGELERAAEWARRLMA